MVGTYATITTFDSNEGDINTLKTVAGVVTSLTGFGVTYNTADFEILDAKDVKVTTGLITSLVGTYVTFQDADFQDDVRVGGALTVVGDLTVNGTTSFVQSTVVQVLIRTLNLVSVLQVLTLMPQPTTAVSSSRERLTKNSYTIKQERHGNLTSSLFLMLMVL